MEANFKINTSVLPTRDGVLGMCQSVCSDGYSSPPMEVSPGALPGEWLLKAELPDGSQLSGVAAGIEGYFGTHEGYVPTTVTII